MIGRNTAITSDISFSRFTRQTREIAKDLVKSGDTIVDLTCRDLELLRTVNDSVNNNCSMIGYADHIERILQARSMFTNKRKALFFNDTFSRNMIKPGSVDLVIGSNILGVRKGTKKNLKEVRRILKHGGRFFFQELISSDKPRQGFITYFKKRDGHIFNKVIFNIQDKLPILRFLQFDIKIIGNGNFYFNGEDISSLQEFCDIVGMRSQDRQEMLSQIYYVCIYGTIR
jgi:SAM-dependent methyltransferase